MKGSVLHLSSEKTSRVCFGARPILPTADPILVTSDAVMTLEILHAHSEKQAASSAPLAAGLSVYGGASDREWPPARGETGGQSGLVEGVKRLLRAAADVVGGNCAAVGSAGELFASALPPNHR